MMVKRTPRRTTRKSKARSHPPREATAKDVMGSLLDLFEHLGIDVSSPITGTARAASREFPQHSLYPHTSSISELLTLWHQDPAYVDDLGNPAPIKLHGPKPSFRQLVRQSQIALNEAYLLSELERLGAVSIDGSDLIKVQMRSFPVYEDKRLAAQHTLATLNGFIKTLRHNLNEIPALKIKVKRHGQSLLESFDNWLMRKALSKPRNRKGRTGRSKVSIGVYLSVEPR
jgi:hypothetical protein